MCEEVYRFSVLCLYEKLAGCDFQAGLIGSKI